MAGATRSALRSARPDDEKNMTKFSLARKSGLENYKQKIKHTKKYVWKAPHSINLNNPTIPSTSLSSRK